MTEDRRLAARFAEISSSLLSGETEDVTFGAVVQRAVEMVPSCDSASITMRQRRGQVATVAMTDALAETADAAQYALGEGPCLDAAFDAGSLVVRDLHTDSRWPRWTERAVAAGLGSAMAVRLHTEHETLGALNLYSRTRDAFDEPTVDVALIFAGHATDAMSKAKLVTGLQAALESRHTIGIAQGVLSVKYAISYEQAFEVLHRYSNDTNTKLRDVAMVVLETGDLPSVEIDPTEVGTAAP